MFQKEFRQNVLKILIVFGLLIAISAALESRVEWLASFCGMFSDGCRETGQFSLFQIPVPLWGVAFYISVGIFLFVARSWVFWSVMVGVGVELTFIRIMVLMKFVCLFCLLNLFIVGLLFCFTINKSRIWQALSIILFFFIVSGTFIKGENSSAVLSGSGESAVVAKVGDYEITREELEMPLAGWLYASEMKIYKRKKEKLEDLIKNELLELDAKEKKVSKQTLMQQIFSKGIDVKDEEVEKYYLKNRRNMKYWHGSEQKLKERYKSRLREKKKKDRIENYTKPLWAEYGVSVSLKPPLMPAVNVNIQNNPFSGPKYAAVTIVEFSDYMCPSCRRAYSMIKEIMKAYQGKIKLVFKDLPLKRHEGSKEMALAARCAAEQGKFTEYQHLLFTTKGKQGKERLIRHAEKLNLDVAQFISCFDSGKYLPKIEKDIQDAKAVGIPSTPSFIINGRLFSGSLSREKLKNLIDAALTH